MEQTIMPPGADAVGRPRFKGWGQPDTVEGKPNGAGIRLNER